MDPIHPDNMFIMTVTGEQSPGGDGPVDAHSHVWISKIPGSTSGSPVLDQYDPIVTELKEFRTAGGNGIIDCQPAGCGRNARILQRLALESRVRIVCCTGFHRRRYYPPDSLLWRLDTDGWTQFFTSEILDTVIETSNEPNPIRAGFIKVAAEASLAETPRQVLEAAISTAIQTYTAIEIHTEKGASAEDFLELCIKLGLNPKQIILCHMDKRPDYRLHQDLAQTGAMLEYDTFFRPQYHPENNLWPLLFKMIEDGYARSIALATDLADSRMWNSMGEGPGPVGFINIIESKLVRAGVPTPILKDLMGGNIVSRLSKPSLFATR